MDKTLSGKYSRIKRRYGEVRKKRAISFLNIAQATAAFNDNLFKFLTINFLIDLKGIVNSTDITIYAGIFYVLPFLLFSNLAGAIADRISKQKIIIWMKALEILIIGFGYYVYSNQMVWGCYACVFLLSLQSAIMSPPKYSIISELVKREQITKANSWVTSYTYLAVIIGTFMAAFLTQATGRNFMLSLGVCLLASLIGFIASLGIPKTKAVGAKMGTKRVPFSQLKEMLLICKKTPKLLLVVLGSAFFLFVGAFTQLNLIPFAMTSLGMSEIGGGYLFVCTSLGIAIGSLVSGNLCKKEVHLGISAFSMIFMCIFVFMIPIFSNYLGMIIFLLAAIGLLGGLYQVPLESYMQTFTASEQRGKIIAAANFLSFTGVLLAPMSMALFDKVLCISPSAGFFMLGVILIGTNCVFIKSLSVPLMNFVSKIFFHKCYDIYYQDFPFAKKYDEQRIAIFVQGMKKRFIFLLIGESMHAHIFFVRNKVRKIDRFLSKLNGIDILLIDEGISAKFVRSKISGLLTKTRPIFIIDKDVNIDSLNKFSEDMRNEYLYHIKQMQLANVMQFKFCSEKIWKKTVVVFSFKAINSFSILKEKKSQYQLT